MSQELETISTTFQIEPLALTVLQNQATWQGITLDELAAYYIGRVATVMEEQRGNALISDVFKHLIERNAPTTQKGSPRYTEKKQEQKP